jgi:2-polyprenyl-3-methyl-5-hydroxy-6-metoxy-1,4-benzoquinol methylase
MGAGVADAPPPPSSAASPAPGGGDRLESYHGLVRSDIFPLVPADAGGTLLDLGGGIGATALALKRMGRAARAGVVDLVAQDAMPGLDFHFAGDLERSDVLDRAAAAEGPFDTILALDVLEHLVDPWAAVARLHAALKPGGIIVASIPNVRYYTVSVPLLFAGRWELADAGLLDRTHLRWFVRKTAIALMTSSGLRLEQVIDKPGGGRKVRLARALSLGLLNGLTDFQYLIRVRRAD